MAKGGLSISTARLKDGRKLRTGHNPDGAQIEPRQKHGRVRIDIPPPHSYDCAI